MEVPTRVKELAIQLTATELTPYDRARAIEQYLRNYPYTLDVPRPPANRDLVDYFLFDLRKGYCDYYASAMVVLSRAAGIPARFAIGYASGKYNLNSKRFMVTQADAHSWVEIYFPDIGWVPFEPTAGLPPIDRSIQPTQEVISAPTIPAESHKGAGAVKIGIYAGYLLLVFVAMTGFCWAILDEIHLRRLKPQLAAKEVYRRMRYYGKTLSVPIEGGETPYEYADALSIRIQEFIRLGLSPDAGLSTISETKSIIRKIVRMSYRPADNKAASVTGIIDKWKALRWRFRLMWMVKIWEIFRRYIWGAFTDLAEKHHTRAE
jgi:hypothetical protein